MTVKLSKETTEWPLSTIRDMQQPVAFPNVHMQPSFHRSCCLYNNTQAFLKPGWMNSNLHPTIHLEDIPWSNESVRDTRKKSRVRLWERKRSNDIEKGATVERWLHHARQWRLDWKTKDEKRGIEKSLVLDYVCAHYPLMYFPSSRWEKGEATISRCFRSPLFSSRNFFSLSSYLSTTQNVILFTSQPRLVISFFVPHRSVFQYLTRKGLAVNDRLHE